MTANGSALCAGGLRLRKAHVRWQSRRADTAQSADPL